MLLKLNLGSKFLKEIDCKFQGFYCEGNERVNSPSPSVSYSIHLGHSIFVELDYVHSMYCRVYINYELGGLCIVRVNEVENTK
jgi:hypothetical protein